MSVWSSGICHPRNSSPQIAGTIHDDAVAADLGFRGGAVAGSIHLEQFSTVLRDAFGPAWFERGSLDLFFTHALTDQEPVEALLESDHDPRFATALMRTPEGTTVASGSATVGDPTSPSALSIRDRRPVDPGTLRIVRDLPLGEELPPVEVTPDAEGQFARVREGWCTSPLPWYDGPSLWGGPICSPLTLFRAMAGPVMAPVGRILGNVIGLYGAIEIRNLSGPVFVDARLLVTSRITDVSETPQTEVFWTDIEARPAGDQMASTLASITLMTRIVKASSPQYRD